MKKNDPHFARCAGGCSRAGAPGMPEAEDLQPSSWRGGRTQNTISIWLTPDGTSYVIDSVVPLEVGGTVCTNPEGKPQRADLPGARSIAGFEVNAGRGDDAVIGCHRRSPIPVTMRGGAGNDMLLGGSGAGQIDRRHGNDHADRMAPATTCSTAASDERRRDRRAAATTSAARPGR